MSSQGSFTEFKRSAVAQRLVALRIPREAFNLHLIGAIAKELVPGITNREDLCRTAWVFHKLDVTDYKLKADLASRALELVRNATDQEFSQADQDLIINADQDLIINAVTRLGKIQILDNAIVAALASEMNNMFPPSTSTFLSNLKVLKAIALMTNEMQQFDRNYKYSDEFVIVEDLISKRCDSILGHAIQVDLSNDELLLIANAYGACEKVPYKYFDFLPSLADVLDAQIERKNSSPQEKTRILAFIINHLRIYGTIKDLASCRLSRELVDHEKIADLPLNAIIHLANGFPKLAGLEQKSCDYHLPADLCVSLMLLCAQKVLETSLDSLTPDEIVSLIKTFSFAVQFDENCLSNRDMWRRKRLAKSLIKANKKNSSNSLDIVLNRLTIRLVELGIGDHLKPQEVADLVLAVDKSKLTDALKMKVLNLLASCISNPKTLDSLMGDKHKLNEVLWTYLGSGASESIKDSVVISIARRVSEETFQLPSKEAFDALERKNTTPSCHQPTFLRFTIDAIIQSNVLELCRTFARALPGLGPHESARSTEVTKVLLTLGNAVEYFVQDLDVFKGLISNNCHWQWGEQLFACLANHAVIQELNMMQVAKLLILLYQSGFRIPKEDYNRLNHYPYPSTKTMALENLVKYLASAREEQKLTGETITSILQALGQAGLRGESTPPAETSSSSEVPEYKSPTFRHEGKPNKHIASAIERLARQLSQDDILNSLSDVQLVYAAQGFGLPDIESEAVNSAMTEVASRLKHRYENSSTLAVSDASEIAHALRGLSQHIQHSPLISDAINILAVHLPLDLSTLSDEVLAQAIDALSKTDCQLPGICTTMYRLVKRWRELGKIYVIRCTRNKTESWYYGINSNFLSPTNWQPHVEIDHEILALAKWLGQPKVMSYMAPKETVYFLNLFSGSNCVAEEIQAAIDAMGARLANEEAIKELSNSEVQNAAEVFLGSGLGTAGVAKATDMLIPKWLSLPDALVKISAEQVVAIVSSIHQSGVRSPNIQAVIRALCKHLVSKSSSFGSPLETPQLAVLIKILRGFDFEGDEILEVMCCLARWVEEQFGSAQRQQPHTIGWPSSSSSSPDRQISREQFCEMVLYVNQLPSTPEVLKTRDTLARRFSVYPEVIKDFSAEQRRALIESYASIERAMSSIRSASEKLQQHNHHG